MFQELSFEDWSAEVKKELAKAGLQLPEEELLILAHMECREERKPIQQFVEETAEEQKR